MKLLLFSSVAALSDLDKLGIIGDYHVRSSHSPMMATAPCQMQVRLAIDARAPRLL